MEKRIILASQSPRRKQLLEGLGLSFIVSVSDVEEELFAKNLGVVTPDVLVSRLSEYKAHSVAQKHSSGIVIGADTVVALDGNVLGKPNDMSEARAMITSLSGRTHTVYSGVTIIDSDNGMSKTICVQTEVDFRTIVPEEVDSYLKKAIVLDKAGAYAIQEHGALFVSGIRGCFFNVVGLPVFQTAQLLKEFGVYIL